MARDAAVARTLVEPDDDELALPTSARRPIVLIQRRVDAPVATSVAPDSREMALRAPLAMAEKRPLSGE